jgi:hypothetical protein
MDKAEVDLRRLRNEAWKHFVCSSARKAFAEDALVWKCHPVTGESLGSYRIVGNADFSTTPAADAWRAPPVCLSRDEWIVVLCTTRCHRECAKGAKCGIRARCAHGAAPLKATGSVGCVAEALQLHPQAEALKGG